MKQEVSLERAFTPNNNSHAPLLEHFPDGSFVNEFVFCRILSDEFDETNNFDVKLSSSR